MRTLAQDPSHTCGFGMECFLGGNYRMLFQVYIDHDLLIFGNFRMERRKCLERMQVVELHITTFN